MTPSQARAIEAPVAEPPPPKAPPPKSVAAELAGSQFNGIKAQRIRPGSDTKVAVVGRNMDQVEKYAQGLKERGHQPEVFAGDKISEAAGYEWTQLKKDYTPNRIPDTDIRKSLMFRENEAWAKKLADQGYTVVDIGNPTQQGLSQFYEMEKGILFPAK
jgi:rhodanese-related sulfurtransferase